MMNEFWTVEWSGSQRCFHVDRLDRTLEKNLETYVQGRSNDYQIVYIAKSQIEAQGMVRLLRGQEAKKAA